MSIGWWSLRLIRATFSLQCSNRLFYSFFSLQWGTARKYLFDVWIVCCMSSANDATSGPRYAIHKLFENYFSHFSDVFMIWRCIWCRLWKRSNIKWASYHVEPAMWILIPTFTKWPCVHRGEILQKLIIVWTSKCIYAMTQWGNFWFNPNLKPQSS